jgi:uncharacterized membrane protein
LGLISSLLIFSALSQAKSFPNFPPPPFKFERAKGPLRLWLAENPSNAELPFWRKSEDLRKKMREQRWIPVSVSQKNIAKSLISYDVKGAGDVHTSMNKAFKISQNFEKLTEVSANFKSVFYDEKNHQLFLVLSALGFETRMILAIDQLEFKKRKEIQFEVVWGELKGLKGAVGFEALDDEYTEVSILSHYEAEKFPLPKVFMGFAFEVLTQKIAEKMRTFIEFHR